MQIKPGTIYGVLLNDRASIERLEQQFSADPYKSAPRAPILYIKPANTIEADGATVLVPETPGQVQIGATIGAVISRPATRVTKDHALSHVAGFRIVADISLPHVSFYRPAIRERCRDGFCPISELVGGANVDVTHAVITLSINGQTLETRTLENSMRRIDQLIADISEFMTLQTGDTVLLGLADRPPLAAPGDAVKISVAGLGQLAFRLDHERLAMLQ